MHKIWEVRIASGWLKKMVCISLLLYSNNLFSQKANAGGDKIIYLTQTSNVTLDGSASLGDTFQWTEISTDYKSGANIKSPHAKVTQVVGLPQGVFYFRLDAMSPHGIAKDSIKLVVDYDVPPRNSTLARLFPLTKPDFVNLVNKRDDTLHHIGYDEGYNNYAHNMLRNPDKSRYLFLERSRLNSMMIDSLRGKFYCILEDGYAWGKNLAVTRKPYARAQISYGNYFKIDTSHTYVLNLKLYFPQSVKENMLPIGKPDWGRAAIFGMHGDDDGSGAFQIGIARDSINFSDQYLASSGLGPSVDVKLDNSDSFVNRSRTIRIIFREGSKMPNQKAFLRVELDGVQKYFQNYGKVGKTLMKDYLKLFGLYDYRNLLVNPDSLSRGKKFSIVIMDANIYLLNAKPTVYAGPDRTIRSNSVTLSGHANDDGVSGNGIITSYKWRNITGPNIPKIETDKLPKTAVSGLINGSYTFELSVTDDSYLFNKDTVTITVSDRGRHFSKTSKNRIIFAATSSSISTTKKNGHLAYIPSNKKPFFFNISNSEF